MRSVRKQEYNFNMVKTEFNTLNIPSFLIFQGMLNFHQPCMRINITEYNQFLSSYNDCGQKQIQNFSQNKNQNPYKFINEEQSKQKYQQQFIYNLWQSKLSELLKQQLNLLVLHIPITRLRDLEGNFHKIQIASYLQRVEGQVKSVNKLSKCNYDGLSKYMSFIHSFTFFQGSYFLIILWFFCMNYQILLFEIIELGQQKGLEVSSFVDSIGNSCQLGASFKLNQYVKKLINNI
ncbi:hypothetical protein pb186bvf_005781 [Paramecium bursaria]